MLCWTVSGNLVRTIDADTFVASLEIWPQLVSVETIRVVGVAMPEMRGAEREQAQAAKEFTEAWLKRGPFYVWGCRKDAFGRFLAVVTREDERLADELKKRFREGGFMGGRK
jgi:endonuclease YncB( thermonuclease family)